MRKRSLLAGIIVCILVFQLSAQIKPSISLSGYASNMQSVLFEDIKGQWISDNLIHNRLNLKSTIVKGFDFSVEMRNRIIYGETVKYNPSYKELIDKDNGWADMSWNVFSDSSYIINSGIDRMYTDITIGNFQATIGRQRINWGMNYVWNPNDIFNSYSFFDFDYVERPGSDALRLQYFITSTSSAEAVAKINSDKKWSAAALLRVNFLGADVQILSGFLDEKEIVIGGGFSRYIGPVSINAEATYLKPINGKVNLEAETIAGFGLAYSTPFNLFIQFEYLYNGAAENIQLNSFTDFYYRDLSIRDLSIVPHTFFSSLTYPATPLLYLGISGMFFPKMKGLFLGPSLDLSLRDDLDLSFFWQYFEIAFSSLDQKINMGFLRLKWSF